MKRILITGASGFVGSFLIPKLLKNKNELLIISRSPERINDIYGKSVTVCKVDQQEIISEFLPEIAINLATYSSSADDIETQKKIIDANIIFLSKLLHALKSNKELLFINTGTFAEYFTNSNELDPAYFYSATKTAGRYLIKYYSQAYSFKTVHVIPYTLYGPNDERKKLIHFLIDSLDSKTPIKTTKGEQILDFLYIDDLIDLYAKIINKHNLIEDGVEFKAGTSIGSSIKNVVKIIEKITNKTANIEWGAIPYRRRDTMQAIANIYTTQNILDWHPKYNLEQGLTQMLKKDNII